MTTRTQLRALIDELEMRYAELDVDDSYDKYSKARLVRGDEVALSQRALHLENVINTSEAVLGFVQTELIQTRAAHSRMINARVAMVAKLPAEILCMIFDMACTEHVDSKAPLWNGRGAISLTCFQWRQVMLLTPELWRQLVVHLRSYTGTGFHGRRDSERMWPVPNPLIIPLVLQRAGPHPLKFQLLNQGGSSTMLGYHWHRILPHITLAIQQSSMVHIRTYHRIEPMSLFSRPVPWPTLHYLWLACDCNESDNSNDFIESDESNAPDESNASDATDESESNESNASNASDAPHEPECVDLSMATNLRLLSITIPDNPDKGSLSFRLPEISSIKRLVLHGDIAFLDLSAALARSVQLEWLDIELPEFPDRRGFQESPITLYSLRHLYITEWSTFGRTRFIVAPRLHSLAIKGDYDDYWGLLPTVSDAKRFPCLLDLSIQLPMPTDVLISFIKALPTLQRVGEVTVPEARQVLMEDNPELHNPDLRALWIYCHAPSEEGAVLRQLAEHLQAARPNCSLYLSSDTSNGDLRKLADEFKEHVHYPSCFPPPDMDWQDEWCRPEVYF